VGLKDRLDRLGKGTPQSPRERANVFTPGGGAAGQTAAPVASLSSDEPKDVIAELRAKMAAILARDVPGQESAPERNVATEEDVLPFIDEDLGAGLFARKLAPQRSSAHVGRMPLSAARDADPEMLSLLALDPRVATAEPRRALYLDTETTGLGGAGALAFLIGLAWFDEEGSLVLEQLLVREPAQEAAVLARVSELVEGASLLVSFNGKSFDFPLLKARCIMNRLPPLPERPHLDLLHVGRRLHKRRLSRCRLKDLEAEVLGWDRGEDDIPGEEIPPRYGHYLRTGDGEALRPVVTHNEWDVLTMAALVGLYGEPIDNLRGEDLLSVAQTLTRARAYDRAEEAAERAMGAGHQLEALELRAHLNKARGDRARALRDFEELSREVDDPAVRLELAKLFEHHAQDFERALQMVELGTGEDDEQLSRRRDRLTRRVATRTRRAPQQKKER
jgi:uncharacterized protein YprB with RNaseH-like and TPR domain